MGVFLLRVKVLALPDIAREVAEDAGEVMVAPPTGRWGLPKLAAAHDATESLLRGGLLERRGAAPKRGASVFDQTI